MVFALCCALVCLFVIALPYLASFYARLRFRHATTRRSLPTLRPSLLHSSFDTLNAHALSYRKQFGDVYLVWNFLQPVVVICSPSAITAYFSTQRYHLRSFSDFFGPAFGRLTGLMLGAADTDRYSRLHPLFAPFYREVNVLRDYDLIRTCVARFLESSLRGGSLSLESAKFEHMPLEILTRLAFGQAVSKDDIEEMFAIYDYQREELSPIMQQQWTRLPGYAYLPTKANSKIAKQVQRFRQFCDRQLCSVNDSRTDLFASLARDVIAGTASLTWEELCHTLYEVTIFNVDITITEMSTVLYNVATMPEWQARIRTEVSNALGRKLELTYGELSGLKELDYFVIESARLRPAVAVTFPEKLAQDQVIGGFLIPAGTSVCASVSSLNRDPELFPNPDAFSPLRHADELTRKSLHRFGLGVRRCMGFRFANTMIKCLLVAAVRGFNVTMPQRSRNFSRTIIPMLPADALAASLRFEPRVVTPQ